MNNILLFMVSSSTM